MLIVFIGIILTENLEQSKVISQNSHEKVDDVKGLRIFENNRKIRNRTKIPEGVESHICTAITYFCVSNWN